MSKKLKNQRRDFINNYFTELKNCIDKINIYSIELVLDILLTAYRNNRKVFILGNGGSASTASHMACDLSKGTLQRIYDNSEKRLRVISLTDNVALMTAISNDLSYENIFIQQLRNLVDSDDIVIAISGSGNSSNVIKAVKYARSCGAITIGLLGFKTGGKLGSLVDCAIIVDSIHYGPIEDIQLILNHIITSWIARVKSMDDGIDGKVNNAVPFKTDL